ncbi:hypothetical protein OC861_007062 [Tilletia horrida]|nr:hypothetical protein OC861_007062 [Tilletia horrida]
MEFKTSITTVTNTLNGHQQYNTRSSLPRSGRPKKLNPGQERLIFRHVLSHRHLNYTRICQNLKEYYNIEIGTALLRGMLMKRGMRRGRALTKMFLTPKNVRDRKDWLAKNKERN